MHLPLRDVQKLISAFQGIHGSSTCLLALLHHSSLLIANLGDCCLLVIRSGEVVFRTSEMQHAFNFPLQLGTHSRDEPMKDAQRFQVEVEREDVVVVGSDGLMDNLVSFKNAIILYSMGNVLVVLVTSETRLT
jgi:serine/threonine protein phosphatase PrpC